jgi:hypothetical protein
VPFIKIFEVPEASLAEKFTIFLVELPKLSTHVHLSGDFFVRRYSCHTFWYRVFSWDVSSGSSSTWILYHSQLNYTYRDPHRCECSCVRLNTTFEQIFWNNADIGISSPTSEFSSCVFLSCTATRISCYSLCRLIYLHCLASLRGFCEEFCSPTCVLEATT